MSLIVHLLKMQMHQKVNQFFAKKWSEIWLVLKKLTQKKTTIQPKNFQEMFVFCFKKSNWEPRKWFISCFFFRCEQTREICEKIFRTASKTASCKKKEPIFFTSIFSRNFNPKNCLISLPFVLVSFRLSLALN